MIGKTSHTQKTLSLNNKFIYGFSHEEDSRGTRRQYDPGPKQDVTVEHVNVTICFRWKMRDAVQGFVGFVPPTGL